MSLAHPFSCSRTRIDRSCVATRVSMTSSSSNSSKKASTIFLIGTMSFTSSAKSTQTKCRSNSCHTRKPKCINLPSKVLCCHQSMNTRWVSLNSWMRSPNTPTNRKTRASTIYRGPPPTLPQFPIRPRCHTRFKEPWPSKLRRSTAGKCSRPQDPPSTLKTASCLCSVNDCT